MPSSITHSPKTFMRARAVRPFATLLVLATMACSDCDVWMPTSITPMVPDSTQMVVAEELTDTAPSAVFSSAQRGDSTARGAP